MHTTTWKVTVFFSENVATTKARAVLSTVDGQPKLEATGLARKNPTDFDVPEIGDELAAARALSSLAHELLSSAAADIEAIRHEPARLHL